MTQADEQALVAAMARREQSALQQLYALYRAPLRRYLWRRLDGDEFAVEDLLQEVFLAVWNSAATFRGESRVGAWLYRIAQYRVVHLRRDTSRRPEGHLVTLRDADDEVFRSAEPRREAHDDEVMERLTLADALGRLSPKHRDALDLIFQHGFTLEETAQILDIPVGTVKSRVSNARKALQRELAVSRAQEEASRGA